MLSCLPLSKPHRLPPVKKKQPLARGPTGEVRDPPHRLRGASRPAVFQWQLGISPDGVRLGKHWGPGCPRRRFGYFAAEGKVTRAGARNTPKQPEGLIKGDSEDLSSDKIPSPPGTSSKSFPPGRKPLLPYCPPTWTNRTLDAETTPFFCGNLSTFFLSAVEMFPDCVILNLYGKIMGKKFPFSEVSLWQKS